MNSQVQKWYDKPISKIILVSISLTWVLPYFGFVLSSFRPGDSIKEYLGGVLLPLGISSESLRLKIIQKYFLPKI